MMLMRGASACRALRTGGPWAAAVDHASLSRARFYKHAPARKELHCRPTMVPRAGAGAGALGGSSSDDHHVPAAAAMPPGTGMAASVFNLINVIMGAGYVSIPFACAQGGWAALPLLWLLGCIFCYTGTSLLACCAAVDAETSAAASARTSSTSSTAPAGYEAVAARAFGPSGAALVSAIMYAELLGICAVYVVLESEVLSTLLTGSSLGTALVSALGPSAYGALAVALMLPTVLLPDLGALSVLGALGVAAAATVGLTLLVLLLTGSGGSSAAVCAASHALLRPATLPSVLGVLAFVYAGHSTFPHIQQSMRNPQLGPRAVMFGYAGTAAICSLLGAAGYALYGSAVAPVVTASMPALSAVALGCTALTLANPFSAFALTLEPVAVAVQRRLWPAAVEPPRYVARAAIRLALGAACCAAGLALPYVADLMGFVGALLTMSISLIIPAAMHGVLLARTPDAPGWALAVDVGIAVLGIVCAIAGASSAANSLQSKLAAAACAAA